MHPQEAREQMEEAGGTKEGGREEVTESPSSRKKTRHTLSMHSRTTAVCPSPSCVRCGKESKMQRMSEIDTHDAPLPLALLSDFM